MLRSIRKKLKKIPLWYKISQSDAYMQIRKPLFYKEQLEELKFYKSLLGDCNKLIFDVGANKGHKSWIFSKLAEKVVMFEPDTNHLKILRMRFGHNHKFFIHDCALSSEAGESSYFYFKNNTGYNTLSEKHINTVVTNRGLLENDTVHITKIRTDTLNNFILKYGVPDYIKIDVEGFELPVIQGLKKPVPLLSFEANLPEFLNESLQILDYLEALLNSRCGFNYSVNNQLELPKFIGVQDFKIFLQHTSLNNLEVYCKRDSQ